MKNPITALSDLFGKLVIEHGSAVIQEKHIALFKDELAILTQKFSLLEAENETLKTENQNLKNENNELKKKIQIYEKPTHENLLDETESNILILLSKHENLIDEQIARSLNLNLQVAKYHLQELDDKKMIGCSLTINSPIQWYLDHEGRNYLIKHKLIS